MGSGGNGAHCTPYSSRTRCCTILMASRRQALRVPRPHQGGAQRVSRHPTHRISDSGFYCR